MHNTHSSGTEYLRRFSAGAVALDALKASRYSLDFLTFVLIDSERAIAELRDAALATDDYGHTVAARSRAETMSIVLTELTRLIEGYADDLRARETLLAAEGARHGQ
jgi:hypothetical protein